MGEKVYKDNKFIVNFFEENPDFKFSLKKIFNNPNELLKEIIPIISKYKFKDIIIIMDYYIRLHPDLKNQSRIWQNTATAIVLYNNNKEWEKFFASTYKKPQECIKSIPKQSTQSIVTVINYYMVFHPELDKEKRNWFDIASAMVLHKSSTATHKAKKDK